MNPEHDKLIKTIQNDLEKISISKNTQNELLEQYLEEHERGIKLFNESVEKKRVLMEKLFSEIEKGTKTYYDSLNMLNELVLNLGNGNYEFPQNNREEIEKELNDEQEDDVISKQSDNNTDIKPFDEDEDEYEDEDDGKELDVSSEINKDLKIDESNDVEVSYDNEDSDENIEDDREEVQEESNTNKSINKFDFDGLGEDDNKGSGNNKENLATLW